MTEFWNAPTGEYAYHSSAPSECNDYVLPRVLALVEEERRARSARRIFEIGSGNGAVAGRLAAAGFDVTAVEVSRSGFEIARAAHPEVHFEIGSAYDDLSSRFGTFPVVLSLEVVEHLYAPRIFAANLFRLLEPGGLAILSTPYHGYIKNLALAVTGRFDSHFDPLWDHGHIKFWSKRTLRQLLRESGFHDVRFTTAGRIPWIAKSMIAAARRSGETP